MGKYIQGFKGMRQDINESNMDPNYYYYAKNLTTSSDENVSNIGGIGSIKSDLKIANIPESLDNYVDSIFCSINGGIEVDINKTILFTTYSNALETIYYNVVYLVDASTGLIPSIYKPIYNGSIYIEGDMGIRDGDELSLLHNKENEAINKIYWIDGTHQVRSLNIADIIDGDSEYLTTSVDLLDATTVVDFSDITITVQDYAGVITAGKVQYAYAYFNKNGQSTGVSPLSEIIPLTKSDGQGGNADDIVGQSNHIEINSIDTNYDFVQLYRVKYNSESETPVISLIQERILESTDTTIGFTDVGTSISEVSIEEFAFLGSDIYYPKAFEIKDDRMFIANFEESDWDITIDQVDCRAYKFKSGVSGALPTSDIEDSDGNNALDFTYIELTNSLTTVPETHDCIQPDYDNYQLKGLGGYGASGMNFELTVTESNLDITHNKPYYRGGEIYRFGCIFINSYGKKSTPHWICDYKMPTIGKSCSVKIEYTGNGITESLEDLDIKGFIGVRMERSSSDKFIVASGISSGCMYKTTVGDTDSSDFLFDNTVDDTYTDHSKAYICREAEINRTVNYPMYTNYYPHYSISGDTLSSSVTTSGFESSAINSTYYYSRIPTSLPFYTSSEGNVISKYTAVVGNTVWAIRGGTAALSTIYYTNPSTSDTVPTSGWVVYLGSNSAGIATLSSDMTIISANDLLGQAPLIHNGMLDKENANSGGLTGMCDDVVSLRGSLILDVPLTTGITWEDNDGYDKKYTFQNTKIWNVNSPEIQFNDTDITSCAQVQIQAVHRLYNDPSNTYRAGAPYIYGENYNVASSNLLESEESERTYNISLSDTFIKTGLYWSGRDTKYNRFTYNWDNLLGSTTRRIPTDPVKYSIYGSPIILEEGGTTTSYNNNSKYKVSNNLYDFTNDVGHWTDSDATIGMNCKFTKSAFIIPLLETTINTDNSDINNHKRLEEAAYDLLNTLGHSDMDNWFNHIAVDLISGSTYATIYGGNTYEARTRNSYITLGSYTDLSTETVNDLDGTGDTYFRNWTFARSLEGELDMSSDMMGMSENISIPIETYVDLNKRNDNTSGFDKDGEFSRDISSLSFEESNTIYNFNTVYNRKPNVITYTPVSYLENTIDYFPNLIRASSQKTPGEIIDSFNDIQVNEEVSLNSKYGPINKLKLFKDNMYVLQENAVAFQSINPVAQIIDDSGLSVELGTGSLFSNTKYLTTESGLLYKDRFGLVVSSSSIYYLDRMNYSISLLNGSNVIGLSDIKFNSKLIKNILDRNSDDGAKFAFDFINNNVLMTLPSDSDDNTIVFNELFSEFISVRTINVDTYIQSRDGVLGIDISSGVVLDEGLYLLDNGNEYNSNLGNDTESKLTILAKPSENSSARYDSIEWKSNSKYWNETLNSLNQNTPNPNIVNFIQAYNEEQNTNSVSVLPRNKFDMWRLNLPRSGSKLVGNRLNGRWLYIDMYLSNLSSVNDQYNIYNLGVNYENKI